MVLACVFPYTKWRPCVNVEMYRKFHGRVRSQIYQFSQLFRTIVVLGYAQGNEAMSVKVKCTDSQVCPVFCVLFRVGDCLVFGGSRYDVK